MLRSTLVLLSALALTAPRAQEFRRAIPDLPGLHSAMDVTIDPDGNLWVCCWQSNQVIKLSPTGQELLRLGRTFAASGGTYLNFSFATSIAAGPLRDVYVTDGSSIYRFALDGSFLGRFGGTGTADGRFANSAGGIAVAPNGDVLVADQGNHRVQRFSREGTFLSAFGSRGSGSGQFEFVGNFNGPLVSPYPTGLDVDASGNVYVVDVFNARVQKFDAAGTPLLAFPIATIPVTQLWHTSLAVDGAGDIYVSRRSVGPPLQKFDATGNLLRQVTIPGTAEGQITNVGGVVAGAANHLFMAEATGRVQEFDAAGAFVARFGAGPSVQEGKFANPSGVAFDAAGRLWVLSAPIQTQQAQQFDQAGTRLGSLQLAGASDELAIDGAGRFYSLNTTSVGGVLSWRVRRYSAGGAQEQSFGPFPAIRDFAVDGDGNVFVAEPARVSKFDTTGQLVLEVGTPGTAPGQLNEIRAITVASDGEIDIADTGAVGTGGRIQRFAADGTFLGSFATFVSDLATDASGLIYGTANTNTTAEIYVVSAYTRAGARVASFANWGGGPGQLSAPRTLAVRDGVLAVADLSHRVSLFDVSTFDQQVPIVTITSPAAGAVLDSPTVQVAGAVADANATTVTSSPVGILARLPAGGGQVGGTLNLAGEGSRVIALSAADSSANIGGTSIGVTVDLSPPYASVNSPVEGSILGSSTVTLSVSVSDLTTKTVTVSHGGGTWTVGTTSAVLFPVVQLAEGPNAITVDVVDAAGRRTTVVRNLRVDLSVPVVSITSPASGQVYGPGQSSIAVMATIDDLSATTVTSVPAGVTGSLPAGGGTVSGTVSLAAEGNNLITVTARDAFNRFGSATVTVVRDTTAPTPTIESPAAGALVRGTIDLAASAVDPAPGSGVVSIAFAIDGAPLGTLEAEPFERTLETTTLADGPHTLTVTARDGAGNARSTSLTFTVDNTPPAVSIPAPAAGVVGDTVTFRAETNDASGITGVTMLVAGAAPTTDGSTSYGTPQPGTVTVTSYQDTTLLLDGPVVLRARATDAAGNTAEASVTITVDNTAPDKTIVSPTDGANVSGIVSIVATANDPNLVSLVVKVDGEVVGSTSASSLTVPYDTGSRGEGPMAIEVVVTDAANNVSRCTITVRVVNFAWQFDPRTLNLGAKGQGVVTAHVEGPNVATLLPLTAHAVELRVNGGNPVRAFAAGGVGDADGDLVPDVTFRFDRQTVIASVRAGIALGHLPASGDIAIELWVDGGRLGTSQFRANR